MDDAWQILRAGGIPLALPRSAQRPTARDLAAATRRAIATDPAGRDAEALAAFVLAWRQHWPTSFAAELGDRAEAVLAWADVHVPDPDRYLKLRRIALESLASVL